MKIQPPIECPSCNSTLLWVKDQLFCKNNNCEAKSFKQLEHFAKTLKIKGLGPQTIEKLCINSISDIYDLSIDYISEYLGSEKIAIKIFNEIERSKTETLNTVLPAFGIALIGKTATDKLSQVTSSIFDIDEDLCKKANLGPKATENLINWIENSFNNYSHLPFNFEFSKERKPIKVRGVVCISGKLNSYATKEAAKIVLEGLGYTVKSDLTKEVTILVNESGRETAKTIKAANNGIQIVTNLKQYMENLND